MNNATKQLSNDELKFMIGYLQIINQQEQADKFKQILNKRPTIIHDTPESFISQKLQSGDINE
jgi:hypothetical protein